MTDFPVMEVCAPQASVAIVPPPLPIASHVIPERAGSAVRAVDAAPVPKKPHRRAVSILAWPAPADLFQAVTIDGEPVPDTATRVYPDARAAKDAAKRWARQVAWEISALVPEPQSQDAELFTMRHRLSILNAFHRKIRRADVIAAMLELFQAAGYECSK